MIPGAVLRQAEIAALRLEQRYDSVELVIAYGLALVLAAVVFVGVTVIKPREVSD